MSEADIVLAALATGEWEIVKMNPSSYLTDEANHANAWMFKRQQPPYCADRHGSHRAWSGPTALAALQAAQKDLGMPVASMQAEAPQVGWKLVPVEPTLEMCLAEWNVSMSDAHSETGTSEAAWRAMLNAAPEAPATKDAEDAGRYRWLRSVKSSGAWNHLGHHAEGSLDDQIDAARKSQGEQERTPEQLARDLQTNQEIDAMVEKMKGEGA